MHFSLLLLQLAGALTFVLGAQANGMSSYPPYANPHLAMACEVSLRLCIFLTPSVIAKTFIAHLVDVHHLSSSAVHKYSLV